jgi:hypothetical protein
MSDQATQEMIRDLMARAERVAQMFPPNPDAGSRITFVAFDELADYKGEK